MNKKTEYHLAFHQYTRITREEIHEEITRRLTEKGIRINFGYVSYCFYLQGVRKGNLIFLKELDKIIEEKHSDFIEYWGSM